MRWRKILKVMVVSFVILFVILFVPIWFAVLRPPSVKYQFLKGHAMLRHGLQGSMSNGPNHGWEWAIFAWEAPFSNVVKEAKSEFVGWTIKSSDPSSSAEYVMFQDAAEHEVIIYSMNLPAKGEFWHEGTHVPNPNSVVVLVTQALADNQFEEIRSRNFRSEP